MKHLNTYITEYIVKKKLDKAIDSEHKYHPQTKDELIENIKELVDKGETDFNYIDTSAITDMSNLFKFLDISTTIDISEWDVSNVTNMSKMFYDCEKINFDISSWDVSKVENMSNMFYSCNLKNTPDWYVK